MVAQHLAKAKEINSTARVMTLPVKQLPDEWRDKVGVVIVIDQLSGSEMVDQVRARLKDAGIPLCHSLPQP